MLSDDIDEAWTLWKDRFFSAADAAIPKAHWRRSKIEALILLQQNSFNQTYGVFL